MSDHSIKVTEDAEPTLSEQAIDEAVSIINESESQVEARQDQTESTRIPSEDHEKTIDSILDDVSRSSDEETRRTLSDSGLTGMPSVSFGKAIVILMIVGLIITILAVLSGGRLPIPPLRQWNAIIGVFLIGYGFLLSLHWR